MINKLLAGRRGEGQAVDYLRKNGYRILTRNLRAKFGEIDVVAQDGPTLCFIEIKSRSSDRFGFPEEAVTFQKRQRLVRLASWYLQRHPSDRPRPVRFDVLSILNAPDGSAARIRLIKGAFEAF